MQVVIGMPFLALSNADIQFDTECFTWRFYNVIEALPKTRRVELINKDKFAKALLDKKSETFVIYVAALEALELAAHHFRAPPLATLQQDQAPPKISQKYVDYANIFAPDLAMDLPENTGISKYAIELVKKTAFL